MRTKFYEITGKYNTAKVFTNVIENEAVEQIKGYAAGPKVRRMIYGTELHGIVMQFRGWELERMEEVI